MKHNCKNNDGGGRGRKCDKRRCNRQENNRNRSGGGERNFPKFADNDRSNNQYDYWQYSNDNNVNNGHAQNAGIVPWFRRNPINPLLIPQQHLNFKNDIDNENKEVQAHNNSQEIVKDNAQKMVENLPTLERSDKENSVSITRKDSVSTTTVPQSPEPPKIPVETNVSIKKEKTADLGKSLKQERKSSSSSSSSSSDSSSSEEETTVKPPVVAKIEITTSKAQSSPLKIKLKPKTTPINSTTVEAPSESSSSSSSSSEEELPKNQEPVVKKEGKPISKKKNSSEDDVVCMGNLENKIVLEDGSDEDVDDNVENYEPTKKVSIKKCKTSAVKTLEKCMLCDKKVRLL